MEPNGGSINLEMGSLGTETHKEQEEEALTSSNHYNMGEANFRTNVAFEGLHTRGHHQQHNGDEVPQSIELSADNPSSEGSDASSRGRGKKESGLRSKRGGKALKIQVFSQQEEAERRRSKYTAAMAVNAPLYPLDLQDNGVDSSLDDESDRSSSFSPEVAANGFGSPIELPSRDGFDTLTGRYDENGVLGHEQPAMMTALEEIPLSTKFDRVAAEQHDSDFDEALLEETVPSGGLSGRALTIYLLKTLILILLWFTFSTLLTVYNKQLLGNDSSKNQKGFPAPYLMQTIHFSLQGLISTILVRCIPSMRPSVPMSWRDYFIRVVPTAMATSLDIGFSNESLAFISVSFMTMCKSSAPIFLLIFAFIFKLEVPSYKLLGIIVVISAGVMMTVPQGAGFNLIGFILVMSAAIMSGFRWTVTQLLLQKEQYGLSNPFAAMSVLTPVMAAISLVLSFALEPWGKLAESNYFDSSQDILISFAIMFLGGSLAFFMVSAEYVLLSETSAVTLTVAGIVKELVTVLVAVTFLKDQFTVLKGFGLAVIIIGVSLYNLYKYRNLRERGHAGRHSSDDLNGRPNYVPLQDTVGVFELGEDVDEDIP
ncbi:unnamed protein product [Calypogeia fissa]